MKNLMIVLTLVTSSACATVMPTSGHDLSIPPNISSSQSIHEPVYVVNMITRTVGVR